MRMIDAKCPACGHITVDLLLRDKNDQGDYLYPACACGATLERVLIGSSAHVHGDDIPGGYWVKNGICNADGTPRKYYSKSEMRLTARQQGKINRVEHIGSPGSDKNRGRHTQRFV